MHYRLKNERVRALKAKERFAQAAAGIGSDTVVRREPRFFISIRTTFIHQRNVSLSSSTTVVFVLGVTASMVVV